MRLERVARKRGGGGRVCAFGEEACENDKEDKNDKACENKKACET